MPNKPDDSNKTGPSQEELMNNPSQGSELMNNYTASSPDGPPPPHNKGLTSQDQQENSNKKGPSQEELMNNPSQEELANNPPVLSAPPYNPVTPSAPPHYAAVHAALTPPQQQPNNQQQQLLNNAQINNVNEVPRGPNNTPFNNNQPRGQQR